jgi:predicted small metal-binding protein
MYEISCRDLGLADCEFYLMAYSLERLELDVLAHARHCHPGVCTGVDAPLGSPERLALHDRIVAAAREVAAEETVV